jgi:hypothetical protein
MNNFICTNFGFVKAIVFDPETKTKKIEYTNRLRYAHAYNSKSAKNVMEKYNIIGWIYNPYDENHVGRDMYEVKRDSYSWENPQKIGEWRPVKAWSTNESDASFLQTRKLKSEDYMTLEEAQAKALELNRKLFAELLEVLGKQTESNKFTTYQNEIINYFENNPGTIIITAEQNTCLNVKQ